MSKKIVSYFLLIAVLGMIPFYLSENFITLLLSRILIVIGVGTCLIGPLTAYRIWYQDETQQRANSWMLMVGAIGNYKLLTAKMGNLISKSKIDRETEVLSEKVNLHILPEKCCVYEDEKLI